MTRVTSVKSTNAFSGSWKVSPGSTDSPLIISCSATAYRSLKAWAETTWRTKRSITARPRSVLVNLSQPSMLSGTREATLLLKNDLTLLYGPTESLIISMMFSASCRAATLVRILRFKFATCWGSRSSYLTPVGASVFTRGLPWITLPSASNFAGVSSNARPPVCVPSGVVAKMRCPAFSPILDIINTRPTESGAVTSIASRSLPTINPLGASVALRTLPSGATK